VDEQATENRREDMRATRDDLAEFDYGPLPDDDDLEAQIAAERREFDSRGN
jgi:N-methylhydantoinase B